MPDLSQSKSSCCRRIATPFNSGSMNRGWIDQEMVPHTAQGEDDLGSAVLARDPLGLEGSVPPAKL